MKYRKKAVVVEASQWWKAGDHAAVVHPVPAEVSIPPDTLRVATGSLQRERLGAIRTLEGWMLVMPGDFIIRGVHGEHYACKPDIFEKTYERVEDDDRAA
jgi:hypothetical protein